VTSSPVETPRPKRPAAKAPTNLPSDIPKLSSDEFLVKAQHIVLDRYNSHRNPVKVPELLLTEINVVWFAKVLNGWKCVFSSTVAKGLLWEVTYASFRNEIYLDVYTKINNIKVLVEEEKDKAA
jgi:Family of unknown function (DUF6275)